VVLAVFIVAITVTAMYGKAMIEAKIREALIAKGLTDISFNIKSLGVSGITFGNIALGDKIPLTLDSLTIDYSVMELASGQVRDLRIDHMDFKQNKIKATLKNIRLHFDGASKGSWSVESVDVSNAPLPIPALTGNGTFAIQNGATDADGAFKSADNTHHAAFDVHYDGDHQDASKLTLKEVSLPWNGGTVSTQNAAIPLAGDKDKTIILKLTHIPLDIVLQGATGSRTQATGTISGSLPMSIKKSGAIVFENGELKADGAGTIKLAPDAIPGDNDKVAIVRDVLSDFHYKELKLGMDSDKDDKLSMLLQLSGNNPAAYNGREVNLNVRLQGDLLNLLEQSILPLTDPKKLLEQSNEKRN